MLHNYIAQLAILDLNLKSLQSVYNVKAYVGTVDNISIVGWETLGLSPWCFWANADTGYPLCSSFFVQ